ncbi:MAG: hypothetical protein OXH31_00390 [Gammaproteobacteria bacterium]|nr:hypothetical protein [Gammaproteobacteria bacterium]
MKSRQNKLIGMVCVILLTISGMGLGPAFGHDHDLNPRCTYLHTGLSTSGSGADKEVVGEVVFSCNVKYVPNDLSWKVKLLLTGPADEEGEGEEGGDTQEITIRNWSYFDSISTAYVAGTWTLSYWITIVDDSGTLIHDVSDGSISVLL